MPQLIRVFLVLIAAAVALTLIFVAWWLAVVFVLVMLVVTQFRRWFGGTQADPGVQNPTSERRGGRSPVVIDGSFVRATEPGDPPADAVDRRRPPLDG